uniref:Uncharacterized protein n=1 Tax=Lepeophtheirus salmonis TaxID=72036 RepID=A0A0K2UXS4_LEPSM
MYFSRRHKRVYINICSYTTHMNVYFLCILKSCTKISRQFLWIFCLLQYPLATQLDDFLQHNICMYIAGGQRGSLTQKSLLDRFISF